MTLLDVFLEHRLDPTQIGWIGFAGNLAGAVGGVGAGLLIDRCSASLKWGMVSLYFGATISAAVFLLFVYLLFTKLLQREAEASTVIQPGLAIPHVVLDRKNKFDILLIRAIDGIDFPNVKDPVHAVFVLAGSKDERDYHLRALMAIAQIAQDKQFQQQWLAARDTEGIRNLILLSTRRRDTN